MKKFVKQRRLFIVSNTKGKSVYQPEILNGNLVLKARENGLLSKESLEAARKAIKKVIKKSGQIIIRSAAYLPLTSKPSEVRMGKGKGKISHYVYPIKAGHVIFELRNTDKGSAKKALLRAAVKLSIKTSIESLRDCYSQNIFSYKE